MSTTRRTIIPATPGFTARRFAEASIDTVIDLMDLQAINRARRIVVDGVVIKDNYAPVRPRGSSVR